MQLNETICEFINTLSKIDNLTSFYESLCEFLANYGGFERVRAYKLSADKKVIVLVKEVGGGLDDKFLKKGRLLIEDNVFAASTFKRKEVSIHNKKEYEMNSIRDTWSRALGKEDVDVWIEMPILIRDKAIGLLCMDNKGTNRPITQNDKIFLENIRKVVTGHLEKIVFQEEAEKRRQLLNKLDDIESRIISELISFKQDKKSGIIDLSKIILSHLTALTNASHCEIRLLSDRFLEIVAEHGSYSHGISNISLDDTIYKHSITYEAINSKKNIFYIKKRDDPFFQYVLENTTGHQKDFLLKVRSWGCFPLYSDEKVIGVINVQSIDYDFLSEHTIWIIGKFAKKASLILNLNNMMSETVREIEQQNKDKTELIDKVSALERNASSSEVASTIIHDLGNKISVLSLNVINIKMTTEANPKLSKNIINHVNNLNLQIENLSEVLETYRKLKWRPLDFNENDIVSIIDEAIKLCSAKAERYNLKIIAKQEGNSHPVRCSEYGLLQVFVNLIYNAIDAMSYSKGSGNKLEIKTKYYEDRCEIFFADEGCGIKPKQKSKVFDFLFTTKTDRGGTGTGLSYAKRLIKTLKGDIDIYKTKVGKGTTFRVTLPIETKDT